jgi:hypothetical protein
MALFALKFWGNSSKESLDKSNFSNILMKIPKEGGTI